MKSILIIKSKTSNNCIKIYDFSDISDRIMNTIDIYLVTEIDTEKEKRHILIDRFGIKNKEEVKFLLSILTRLYSFSF